MYVINLDVKESKEIHWVSLFIEVNTALYFDSFGIEYITQEVLNKIWESEINQLFTIYLKYKITIPLCVDHIVLLS